MSKTKDVSTAMFVGSRSTSGKKSTGALDAFKKDMERVSVRQNLIAVMEKMELGDAKAVKMDNPDDYRKWLAHAHAITRRYLVWGKYAARYKLMQDNEGFWFCIYRKAVPGSINGKQKAAA